MSASTPCRQCARGAHHACMGWCSCGHARAAAPRHECTGWCSCSPTRTATPARPPRATPSPRPRRPAPARHAVPVELDAGGLPYDLPLDWRVACVRLLNGNGWSDEARTLVDDVLADLDLLHAGQVAS